MVAVIMGTERSPWPKYRSLPSDPTPKKAKNQVEVPMTDLVVAVVDYVDDSAIAAAAIVCAPNPPARNLSPRKKR